MGPVSPSQRPVFAPETIPDYTSGVKYLFQQAFTDQIEHASPDPKKLEELLPEILSSDKRIIDTLQLAASNGHMESFEYMLPFALQRFGVLSSSAAEQWHRHRHYSERITTRLQEFQFGMEMVFFNAADAGHDSIAHSMLNVYRDPAVCVWVDKVEGLTADTTRMKFFTVASCWTIGKGRPWFAERLSKEWFSEDQLRMLLHVAARENYLNLTKALVDNLISQQREAMFYRRYRWDDLREERWFQRVEMVLADALMAALCGDDHTEIVKCLFMPYLDARLAHPLRTDRSKCEPLEHLTKDHCHSVFTRKECFQLLDRKPPSLVKLPILTRLGEQDHNEKPATLTLITGDYPVVFNRDVLCWWSSYIRELPPERDILQLNPTFTAEVVEELYTFVHSGIAAGIALDSISQLQRLSQLASLFKIDRLRRITEEKWWAKASALNSDSDTPTPSNPHPNSGSRPDSPCSEHVEEL
ncbi:hypothetical protein BDV18DRAFT_161006 [Aspergillus unguis]